VVTITNIAMVRNYEVVPDKFNVTEICTIVESMLKID
jgi:hypothetical protein